MKKFKKMALAMAVMVSLFSNSNVMAAKMEKTEVAEKNQSQEEMQEVNSRIEELQEKIMWLLEKMENANRVSALVNPNQGQKVSYTQDGANSQENSMVVFKYAPNQLYKIYCRVGYLTDLIMKKGETITFVGGGDTSAWAVEKASVDGVEHIYIKPTVETSTTNLIITTNKRSYQLILNTSDWYNPMVTWNYGQEEQGEINYREKESTISKINGTLETLNFAYKISGKAEIKLATVFDDGEKTILKFEKMPKRLPSVFMKNKGKVNMTNYKIRDNCYILDRVAEEIEIVVSEKEKIKIKRKQ